MNGLILCLLWVNAAIWSGVTWQCLAKIRRSLTGIRSMEATFAGVSFVLALYMFNGAWLMTNNGDVLPDAFVLVHPLVVVLVSLLILFTGVLTLVSFSRWIDRLDQLVAQSSLQARYRYMIEADPRMILMFDTGRHLLEINKQGRELLQRAGGVQGESESLIGMPLIDLLTRLQPDDPESLLQGVIAKEPVEVKWRDRIFSEFDWSVLHDEGGQQVGGMFSFRDVTEDRKFQREYIHSEKLAVVGQLAAATAHEIRNPLTSIKGFLQLLEHRLRDNRYDGEMREYTRIMVEEVDRMEKIIRDFLLMTKPSDVVREKADINSVIERMLIIVQNQATLRNIHVRTELGDLPPVLIHKEAIQQVILNLLQNAFEAMNTGGTLTLQTLEESQFVAIRINDTGVGMTEEEVANLGSPFYSTKTEGTGLGLTVSSKIIKEHGGRLEVNSEKGVGTKITVRLPK